MLWSPRILFEFKNRKWVWISNFKGLELEFLCSQIQSCKKVVRSIYVSGRSILMRIYILFALLVVNLSGDVELNPGPPKPSEPRARTRQQTLSFAGAGDRRTSSGIPFEAGRLSRSPVGGPQSESFSFLTHMKNDLSTQMTIQSHDVMREVGTIKTATGFFLPHRFLANSTCL